METIGNAGFTSSTVGKPWFSSGLRLVIQGVGTFYGVVGFRVYGLGFSNSGSSSFTIKAYSQSRHNTHPPLESHGP